MKIKATDIIHPSWDLPLDLIKEIKTKINTPFNPELRNLFRVFSLDVMSTKCIIIGLSPYQTKDNIQSNGLAFGSNSDTPSLQIIRQAMWRSYHELAIEEYFDNSMEHWHNQGVLMLNASLTVPKFRNLGNPLTHLSLWREFISKALKYALTVNPTPVWFVGQKSKTFKKFCTASPLLLESCHPRTTYNQLIKYRYNEDKIPVNSNFTISPNFIILDTYFKYLNGESIKWINYENSNN